MLQNNHKQLLVPHVLSGDLSVALYYILILNHYWVVREPTSI